MASESSDPLSQVFARLGLPTQPLHELQEPFVRLTRPFPGGAEPRPTDAQ